MASHYRTVRILAALLLAMGLLAQARPTAASKLNTSIAIINQVNLLRAAHGLAPYQIDAEVMAFAQQHSEYQASIKLSTHTHSDGTTALVHGMRENIATGTLGYMTPEFAVYTVWADAIHMDPMVGYASGYVGAGVADDGTDVYYTLNVRPGTGAVRPGRTPGAGGQATGTPAPVIPIVPLATVTPRPDGWNIHTVGYGQTLWGIAQAYGVPADMIRAWNSMEAESNDIYAGQKLIIRAAAQAAATSQPAASGTPPVVSGTQPATSNAPVEANDGGQRSSVIETGQPGDGAPPTIVKAAAVTTTPPTIVVALPSGASAQPERRQPAGAGNGPLAAGLLILFGGTLLVVLAFALIRKS